MKDLAQACAAFQGRPDEAVDRIASVFDSEERFKSIFPDHCHAQQLLLPYILFLKASETAKNHVGEHEWSTTYLRYPMVAGVAAVIFALLDEGIPGSYLGTVVSKELADKCDEWAPDLFEPVFEELARYVNAQTGSGRGIRAIVRRREYLEEVIPRATERVDLVLSTEKNAAGAAGLNPDQFGLRAKLPGIAR